MPAQNLTQWLHYIKAMHPTTIDLGLDRIKAVAERLKVTRFNCPVIMVTGTNGKGSTVTSLRSIYHAAGYRTGSFTSPELLRYTDQILLNNQEVSESALCSAFASIEVARGAITLTPFEFLTLGALWLFQQTPLDIVLLEVGMGGRDDAVNIVDADIAIITTVSLEHQQWLGDSIEAIAEHKAGIMRAEKPVICGMPAPPHAILSQAQRLKAPLYRLGKEFSYDMANENWRWNLGEVCKFCQLPFCRLDLDNVAIALMAITILEDTMNVNKPAIYQGIQAAELPGRFQVMDDEVTTVFDVAHNPQSCENLMQKVKQNFPNKRIRAVVGMLKDKDIPKCLKTFQQHVVKWYISGLDVERGASCEKLQKILKQLEVDDYLSFPSIEDALQHAKDDCEDNEIVLVFGSFITVAKGLHASKHEHAA
ncbi:MAG: bifunctional tetrahydrofolate synthase/dihydrofolate synthase [Legionellales bacterium]|nr:bifunctional tetrahydrofolate synthase/dihydrofolate synthase [Legionellales bacterium]